MMSSIAKRWEELSGGKNWEGLIDPLDIDLRQYLIHYGERAQAIYDAFNATLTSPLAGSSRYSEANLFAKVGLEKGNPFKYEVTKYFYATSGIPVPDAFIVRPLRADAWSAESNWMGYVAVAADAGVAALGRRDIIVCWRGTVRTLEWVNDFDITLVRADKIFGGDGGGCGCGGRSSSSTGPMVHGGFYSIYTSQNPKSAFNVTSARDQVPIV